MTFQRYTGAKLEEEARRYLHLAIRLRTSDLAEAGRGGEGCRGSGPRLPQERPLGAWKFVWLMTLKASTRNWNLRASCILKSFETEASKSTSPGARLESRETLPKPVATICVRTPLMVL